MSRPVTKLLWKWVSLAYKNGSAESFRVETDDGAKIVKLARKGPSKVINPHGTAKTIEALSPSRVEALNGADEVVAVWSFPDEVEAPGYAPAEGDTDDSALLKVFAHLLSDAHKLSAARLVEVVRIQSETFAEERKAAASAMLSLERAMQKMARTARLRVSSDEDDDAPEAEQDTFVQDMLAPLVKRYMATRDATPAPATANGAAAPPTEGE